jgi:hypothetical protein
MLSRTKPKTIGPQIKNTQVRSQYKFHGNMNEDVDDWLNKVKINLDIAQIPSDKYFDYLTNYCVGKAGTSREDYVSRMSLHFLE